MAEDTATETETPTETTEKLGNTTSDTDNESSPIDKVQSELDRVKAINRELEAELIKSERLKAEAKLAGDSGGNQNTKPKEESPEEYLKKVENGEVQLKDD